MVEKGKTFLRPRNAKPGEQRLAWQKGDKPLANSTEGEIKELEELGIDPEVKSRIIKPLGTSREMAELEYDLTKKTPHLHPRLVQIGDEYFLILNKMPGTNLGEIIDLLNQNKITMSAETLIKVAIAMVDSLQKQVFDAELLHCDIKPAQMMLDSGDPSYPVVNYVDFGSAKLKNNDKDPGGKCTSGYEIAGERRTEKSDIFGLGVSLIKLLSKNITNSIEKTAFHIGDRKCQLELRDGLAPLNPKLTSLLQSMVETNPESRPSTTVALHALHELRNDLKHHARQTIADASEIAAKQQAFRLHQMPIFRRPKTLSEIIASIESPSILKDNENNPAAVEEYIAMSGERAFRDCASKNDILSCLKTLEKNHDELKAELRKKIAELKTLLKNNPNEAGAIKPYTAYLERKEKKYLTKNFATADEYAYAINAMRKALHKYNNIHEMIIGKLSELVIANLAKHSTEDKFVKHMQKVLLALRNHSNTEHDEPLAQLKYQIKIQILNYILENATKDNILKGERAISLRRIGNMKSILDIVNTAPDANYLKREVENQLAQFETGWFYSSDLRNKVSTVIEEWEKTPKQEIGMKLRK